MKPKLIELRPDRFLLNSNFEGYKLSLATLPVCQKTLQVSIDRAAPDSSQYSLLHARLFGLHNHIFAEELQGMSYIYYVDKNWRILKTYAEPFSHQLTEPIVVFEIPKNAERVPGQYNITLKFVTSELAVLSAPDGILYILNTGDRSLDIEWNINFKGDILGVETKFVIQDALFDDKNQLHLLLLKIETSGEHWSNILNWIVMTSADKEWNVVDKKELRASGELYYSHFEPDCKALIISSEKSFKFIGENDEDSEKNEEKEKRYSWSQTVEDITVKFKLPENWNENSIKITTKPAEIIIQYENSLLLAGRLYKIICPDLTVWETKNNVLEVCLAKQEIALMWPEFVVGDDNGEFVVDTCIADEVHEKLSGLCSENEVFYVKKLFDVSTS